jgi:hypothetical protein
LELSERSIQVSAIDLFRRAAQAAKTAKQAVTPQTVTPMQATATANQWVRPVTPESVTPMQPSAAEQIKTAADNNMLGAGNVVNDMTTGDAYNAAKAKQDLALARSEQQQRAATAAGIQRMGLAGTPVGAGYGNAAESDMLRNRFEHNLNTEVARQETKERGATMAMNYADMVNKFEQDDIDKRLKGLAADDAEYEIGRKKVTDRWTDFSDAMTAHLGWIDIAKSGPMGMAQLRSDPEFMKTMTAYNGGDGNFTDQWAMGEIMGWHQSTDTMAQATRAFMSMGMSEEDASTWANRAYLNANGLDWYEDENGDMQVGKIEDIESGKKSEEKNTAEWQKAEAARIASGQIDYSGYDFSTETGQAVYKQLLTNSNVIQYKNGSNVEGSGFLNYGYTTNPSLETAYSKGSLVNRDGSLYKVQSLSRTNKFGSQDSTTYVLVDIKDGSTKTITV